MVSDQDGFSDRPNRGAGFEAERKERTHDACEDGDEDTFSEGEIGFAGFHLVFWGDFLFLGEAGKTVDGDRNQAEDNASENDLSRRLVHDDANGAVVDGWDQGAEGGAQAEGNGVSEGDAQVANGETEGKTTYSPECAP